MASAAFPYLQPNSSGSVIGYGNQHPYSADPQPVIPAPPRPDPTASQDFLPSVFRDPYLQGLNAAAQTSNWASQALPGASNYLQGLYSGGLNQIAQTYLQSAAELSNHQLAGTLANLGGMFENSASHGSLAPAYLQAANQSGAQLGQLAGQLGTQQMQQATSTLPFTFGFPIQAAQAGQQSSQGLYSQAQNAMYGDLQFPLAMFGSNPYSAPTVVSQPGTSSGKGK